MARRNKAEIELTARDRTKGAFSAVNRRLGQFGGVALAGAAAGLALLTRNGLRQIDALAKQSQLLGITTEKLAALQLVSAKTGVEQKTLEKSLINVTRVVAEAAEGTGLAVDTLKKLGLEAKTLARESPDEQFRLIADAMKGLNTQAEKVLAAYELFGGRGAALLRTLEAGSAGFEEAEEKTKRFGTAISAVDAKGVEDANDAFTDLGESVKGVGFDLARRFAPGMQAASTSTANFIVSIRRDFIPAMALLLEQMDILVSNVRGLSEIELEVRVQVQEEALAEIEKEIQKTQFLRPTLQLQKAAAEARLKEVENEQKRRAEIILDADRQLEQQRVAQMEEARIKREEVETTADQERFDKRLELEQEKNSAIIALALNRGKEERRLRFQEAREEQRALIVAGKLEAQAAQQTILLRQATARTSIQILQSLVGKNRIVARALFLVEKGLAIARTVQNTAAASVKALAELGPIAGPPAAAAIQAFGAAQIGLIAATALTGVSGVGGGGGIGGLGGGGGFGTGEFGGGGDVVSDSTQTGGGSAARNQGVVQLIFPNLFGITPDAIDALADALREASENRDVIIVSGQGRNAELLAGANG